MRKRKRYDVVREFARFGAIAWAGQFLTIIRNMKGQL